MINLNQPDSERTALCMVGAGIVVCLLGLFYIDNDSSSDTVETQQISSLLNTTCDVVDANMSQYASFTGEDKVIANSPSDKCKTIRIH